MLKQRKREIPKKWTPYHEKPICHFRGMVSSNFLPPLFKLFIILHNYVNFVKQKSQKLIEITAFAVEIRKDHAHESRKNLFYSTPPTLSTQNVSLHLDPKCVFSSACRNPQAFPKTDIRVSALRIPQPLDAGARRRMPAHRSISIDNNGDSHYDLFQTKARVHYASIEARTQATATDTDSRDLASWQ